MDNNEDKKVTQYLIPANVTTKFEFFPGFGWHEFKIVLIACIIGTIFFFLLGVPKKTIPTTVTTTVAVENEPLPKTTLEIHDKKVSYIPVIIRILFIVVPGAVAFFVVKRAMRALRSRSMNPFLGLFSSSVICPISRGDRARVSVP